MFDGRGRDRTFTLDGCFSASRVPHVMLLHRIRSTFLLAFFAAASACADGESSATSGEVTVRDSAGIRIVESDPVGLPIWSVGPEPVLAIGSLDDPDDALYRVSGVDRLSDGTWVVANRGLSEIRLFDGEGGFVGTIGGPGEGPGEFTSLSAVFVLPGDSLLAWDFQRRRATVFDREGRVARSFVPTTPDDGQPASPVARFRSGGLLLDGGSSFGGDDPTTDGELVRPDVRTFIGDAEGVAQAELARIGGRQMWLVSNESFVSVRSVPFAKGLGVAAVSDRAITGVTERAEFRVWDPDGSEIARWRIEVEPPPVTEGDWQRALDAELEDIENVDRRRETGEFFDDVPRPERHPVWASIVASDDGELWVERFRAPGMDGPGLWWVIDASGEVIREVRLPAGLEVRWIAGGLVAGTVTDELDVEYLHVYRVGASEDRPG